MANADQAGQILTEVFRERPLAEWREALAPFTGQWTVVQDTLECVNDVQTVANGYMQGCTTAAGKEFQLVAAPIQFDGKPATPRRAPEFNEHGDEILAELGLETEAILDLKIKGVIA
jgi:crotonobetainyl-CoA:carnitine CoA-transferase CaiB-like acyl-CoA transferase